MFKYIWIVCGVGNMWASQAGGRPAQRDDIYMEILPSRTYMQRISDLMKKGMNYNARQASATELLEMMVLAYKNGAGEQFDRALEDVMEHADPAEISFLTTFVRTVQKAKGEKLFDEDVSPLITTEFKAMQEKCHDLMQIKMEEFLENVDLLKELYAHAPSAQVSYWLLEEYPNAVLTQKLLESSEFYSATSEDTATGLHDFVADYYRKSIADAVSSAEDREQGLMQAFDILMESPLKYNGYIKFTFNDPMLDILPDMVRFSGTFDSKSLQNVQKNLLENEVFNTYPTLWFRIAERLIDVTTTMAPKEFVYQTAQLNKLQTMLGKTITGKKTPLGQRIAKWMRNYCNLSRLKLRVTSYLFYRDDDARYLQAKLLLSQFNDVQKGRRGIVGDISEAARIRILQDVGAVFKNVKGDVAILNEGRMFELFEQLYEVDPRGKLVQEYVVEEMNPIARKDFVEGYRKFQEKIASKVSARASGAEMEIVSTQTKGAAQVDALLRQRPALEFKPREGSVFRPASFTRRPQGAAGQDEGMLKRTRPVVAGRRLEPIAEEEREQQEHAAQQEVLAREHATLPFAGTIEARSR